LKTDRVKLGLSSGNWPNGRNVSNSVMAKPFPTDIRRQSGARRLMREDIR